MGEFETWQAGRYAEDLKREIAVLERRVEYLTDTVANDAEHALAEAEAGLAAAKAELARVAGDKPAKKTAKKDA